MAEKRHSICLHAIESMDPAPDSDFSRAGNALNLAFFTVDEFKLDASVVAVLLYMAQSCLTIISLS